LKFVFFAVSENGENGRGDEEADRANASPRIYLCNTFILHVILYRGFLIGEKAEREGELIPREKVLVARDARRKNFENRPVTTL